LLGVGLPETPREKQAGQSLHRNLESACCCFRGCAGSEL
jgi:hypothetical protein